MILPPHLPANSGVIILEFSHYTYKYGAETLVKFSKTIDTKSCGAPAFMAVVTATGFGYRRDDDIYVLPIGSLKP